MSLTSDNVKHIAKLARIRLEEGEVDSYVDELNKIFEWIEQLQQVDTEGVQAMAGVGDYTLRLRADEVKHSNIRDDVLANAPDSQFDCYVVPKVVE